MLLSIKLYISFFGCLFIVLGLGSNLINSKDREGIERNSSGNAIIGMGFLMFSGGGLALMGAPFDIILKFLVVVISSAAIIYTIDRVLTRVFHKENKELKSLTND